MTETFDSILADLQVEFQAALEEHCSVLRAAQTAWQAGDGQALNTIRLRVHRIAGVAGLFQADTLSHRAEAVERAILEQAAPEKVTVFLQALLDVLPVSPTCPVAEETS